MINHVRDSGAIHARHLMRIRPPLSLSCDYLGRLLSFEHPDITMADIKQQDSKVQPWKRLLPEDGLIPELKDICVLTDRPWVRQQLADRYKEICGSERQNRHPEYSHSRRSDPFPNIYKAERYVAVSIKL